jgi:hypothetical protein
MVCFITLHTQMTQPITPTPTPTHTHTHTHPHHAHPSLCTQHVPVSSILFSHLVTHNFSSFHTSTLIPLHKHISIMHTFNNKHIFLITSTLAQMRALNYSHQHLLRVICKRWYTTDPPNVTPKFPIILCHGLMGISEFMLI